MLTALQALLLLAAGGFLFYLAFLSVAALFATRRTAFHAESLRSFAVVVPAHNEELSIRRTLESLGAMEYPADRRRLLVVADNCTDATAAIAREAGAEVWERSNREQRGKGYALRWCFDRLVAEQQPVDAVVVIDADTTVAPDLLTIFNHDLEKGSTVLQASDLVAPRPGAWSSEATRLGFFLYNHVRPLGRRVLGCPTGLRGNGMCFRTDVLRDHPWNAFSVSEDLEFGLQLFLAGHPAQFVPEAIVLATMPENPDNAVSQRSRWEGGRYAIVRRYIPLLLNRFVSTGSLCVLDAAVDLAVPALTNLLAFTAVMAFLSALLGLFGVDRMMMFGLLWCGAFGLGLLHLLAGLRTDGADPSLRSTLAHAPRYAFWKMMVYARMAKEGRPREWVRTTREGNRK